MTISASEHLSTVMIDIMRRDAHRVFRLHHAVRIASAVAAIVAVNLFATNVLLMRQPIYRYIFTDPYGKIVDLIPVTQPNHDDDYVMKWAVNTAVEAYTFDFKNYQRQLFAAQNDMTVVGWKEWEKALKDSGNFRAVIENGYVATAVPNGPATIVKRGDFNGRYAWRVRFPLLVIYQSSLKRTNQELIIEEVVIRQPEYINYSGLGLRQVIAIGGST